MNLKEYRLALLVAIVSIVVLGSLLVYTLQNQKAPEEQPVFQYPTGTALSLGTITTAQGSDQQTSYNTISVSGSGTASMQADDSTVTLGVQVQEKTASEAVNNSAASMTAVINAIKTLGLTEENLRTVSYNLYPVYSGGSPNTIVGYGVVSMIAVNVTNMGLIGQVIDIAVANGANIIQGVSFDLSNEKQAELQAQAYVAALRDAEGKASLIAGELKVKVTGVLSVSENVYSPYQPYYDYSVVLATAAAPTPIIQGRLSVSVTVHVVYAFS
jgi:uncharacterized protein YggE